MAPSKDSEGDDQPVFADNYDHLPMTPDRLSMILKLAHSDARQTNAKKSAANSRTKSCPKCDEPQPITQFAKHVRNCSEA